MEPDSDPKQYIKTEGATFAAQARMQIIVSARLIVEAETVDQDHLKLVLQEFGELLGFTTSEFVEIYRMLEQFNPDSIKER